MRALLAAARPLYRTGPLSFAAQLLSSSAMTIAEVAVASPNKRQKQAHYEHTREVRNVAHWRSLDG
jgi:hypothetical protein